MRCHRLFVILYNKIFIRKYTEKCSANNYRNKINKLFERVNSHLNDWFTILSVFLIKLLPKSPDSRHLSHIILRESSDALTGESEQIGRTNTELERSHLTRLASLKYHYNADEALANPVTKKGKHNRRIKQRWRK
jgi:hypothetical protein